MAARAYRRGSYGYIWATSERMFFKSTLPLESLLACRAILPFRINGRGRGSKAQMMSAPYLS